MRKSFAALGLPITEEEYRNDGNLHYSTIATYERGGFESIETLGEKKESPSLLFGSCVDLLITGTREEFDKQYFVAEYPTLAPALGKIVETLFGLYHLAYSRISQIPDSDVILITEQQNYQLNWKPETRAKVVKEKGEEYYNLLILAEGKTVLDAATYQDVMNAVEALKTSEATKWYFAESSPFDGDDIERVYQPKLLATFEGVTYSGMMDLVVIDHKHKLIYPCDLKTSSHTEYNFFESFVQWNYDIQAREYAAIIKANIEKDEYFKDFTIMPYRFIVVNRKTLNPLVWEWPYTFSTVTVDVPNSKGYPYRFRHFHEIGKELYYYLQNNSKVPNGIVTDKPNNIVEWLKQK